MAHIVILYVFSTQTVYITKIFMRKIFKLIDIVKIIAIAFPIKMHMDHDLSHESYNGYHSQTFLINHLTI